MGLLNLFKLRRRLRSVTFVNHPQREHFVRRHTIQHGRQLFRRLHQIEGAPPDMRHPPTGDPFAARNAYATPRCLHEAPPLAQAPGAAPGHLVAAWYDLPALLAAEGSAR